MSKNTEEMRELIVRAHKGMAMIKEIGDRNSFYSPIMRVVFSIQKDNVDMFELIIAELEEIRDA